MPVETFTTAGTTSWTAPAGVTSVVAEVWDAGGGGGDSNGATGGGGGAGGSYIRGTLAVVATTTYTNAIVVGAVGAAGTAGGSGGQGGASSFILDGSHYVGSTGDSGPQGGFGGGSGGNGGTSNAKTSLGATSTAAFTGGNGAGGSLGVGGGAGSSAGTAAGGTNGSGSTGGVAPSGGGDGGRGGDFSNGSVAGSNPGGGGGGAGISGLGITSSAGATGKIVLTYTESTNPETTKNQFLATTEQAPPFPGIVTVLKNMKGDVAPAVASGESAQIQVRTANPEPFPGQVIVLKNLTANTPIITSGVNVRTYRPIPEERPPFPGAVLHALSTPFGISSLPSRPVKVEAVNSQPFEGSISFNRNRLEMVRDNLQTTIAVRADERPPMVAQPSSFRGTPAREAYVPTSHVLPFEQPIPFQGGTSFVRQEFGISPIPSRPITARMESTTLEPGRVIVNASFEMTVATPRSNQKIIGGGVSVTPPFQVPVFWHGTPPRDAAIRTGSIVSLADNPSIYPGSVMAQREAFGISSLPPRIVIVREPICKFAEGSETGKALFSRATPTDPVRVSRSTVIGSASVQFGGLTVFSGGRAAPSVVSPRPMIVAGKTDYPNPSEPFFGWGFRDGSSAPPVAPCGNAVTLDGVNDSVVTLTSLECEC